MEPETGFSIITWITENYKVVIDIVAYAVVIASLIVKATPTLKDDNILKPIVKFIGKFIALDKYGPTGA